jgi:hypothetical protein
MAKFSEGQSTITAQNAHSDQPLPYTVEQAETIAGIKIGLESLARGEGVPAKTVFAQLRRKHNIPTGK